MKVIPKSIHHLLDDSKGGIKKSYLEENYYDKDYIDDNFVSEADVSNFVTIQGPLQTVLGEKKLKNISLLNIPGTAPSSSDIDSGKSYLYSSYGSYAEVPGGGGGGGGETLTILRNGTQVATYNGSTPVSANILVPTTVASLSDASDYATKAWVENKGYITSAALSGYVTIATDQEITGAKYFSNALAIPLSAPSSPTSGLSYLYAGSGSYAEEPGGGVADVYPLTITKNGSSWLYYDPGEDAVSVNLSVPTKVSDLTNDTGFITSSSLTGYATQTWVEGKGYITSSALNGYVNDFEVTGNGNAVTTGSKSGSKITLTKDNTFVDLTSEQKITGAKKHANVALLNIPTSISSSDIESGKVYLYSGSGEYAEEASGGVADVYPLYLVIGGTTTTYDPASESTTVTFGGAAKKGYTTSITQGSADLPTSDAVYSAIAAAVTSALHYRGMSSTALTDGGTETATIGGVALVPQSGDVVIYGGFEFLWENSVWNKLGDDSSYALKTVQISAGTGLTGGGDLTASRTLSLSSATQTDIGKGVTAYNSLGNYLPLAGNSTSSYVTGPVYFDAGNNSCVIKNIFYNTTTGWSRDVVRLAVDGTNKFTIGAYGSYTSGGSGNGITYAYIGCNAYDGLNLRITSDSLKWGTNVIYHEGNLTKNVLTTILDSDGGYYLKLTGGTLTGTLNARDILPSATTTYALGSSSKKWNEAWVAKAHFSSLLAIPTAAPASGSVVSGEAYLYSGSGSYAETPGGGVADVYPLTITKNGSAWLYYNPGTQAESINLTIPTKVSDLTNDTGFITASSIPSTYAWSAITNTPTTLSGYGITDAKIETPSGTSNRKITLGSNNFTIYSWALASAKPSYTLDEVADGSTRKLANYLPLAGNAVASKITGNVILGNNVFLQGVHTNGTNVRELIGLDNNNIVTVGCSTNQLRLITSSVDIKHNKNGTLYSVYDESNLSLATLAGSSAIGSTSKPVYYNGSSLVACGTSLTDYLPLSGGTMSNTNLVTNMNADLLDGEDGSYYNNFLTYYNGATPTANGITYPLALVQKGTPTGAWWYVTTMYYSAIGSNFYSQIATSYNATTPDMYIRQTYNGTATSWYKLYHDGNLTKSVLTTLLDSNSGYYLPLAGGTMTGAIVPNAANTIDFGTSTYYWKEVHSASANLYGNLAFNAPSAGNVITWINSSNVRQEALSMRSNGHLILGANQITNSKDTYVYGTNIYVTWKSTRQIHFTGDTIIPNSSNAIDLGTSSNYWKGVYAGTLYGTLNDFTYLTNHALNIDNAAVKGVNFHYANAGTKPTGSQDGSAFTLAWSSAWVTQMYGDWRTNKFYTRVKTNGTWGDWAELATTKGTVEGLNTSTETDATFVHRAVPSVAVGDVARVTKVKGKTIVWNQQINPTWLQITTTSTGVTITNNGDGSWTLTGTNDGTNLNFVAIITSTKFVVGHKYLLRGMQRQTAAAKFKLIDTDNGYATDDGSGVVYTATNGTTFQSAFRLRCDSGASAGTGLRLAPQLIDLTLMFGKGSEPTSVAEFEALYPLPFYSYNTGELVSNKAESIETIGFNIWDEEWEIGTISGGVNASSSTRIRSKNYIPVFPNTTYFYKITQSGANASDAFFYDAEKNFLSSNSNFQLNSTFTTPGGAYYMRFTPSSQYGNTYRNDICLNLSDTTKNGTYEPYRKDNLPLNITKLKVDTTNLWDGIYEAGIYDSNGAKIAASNSWRNVHPIPVSGGKIYYTNYILFRYYYDAAMNFISYDNSGSYTFTTPANAVYMNIRQSQETAPKFSVWINTPNKRPPLKLNQLLWIPTFTSFTQRSVTITNNNDGTFTLNGTADSSGSITTFRWSGFTVYGGRKYLTVLKRLSGTISVRPYLRLIPTNKGAGTGTYFGATVGTVSSANEGDPYMAFYVVSGTVFTNYRVMPMLIDLTAMYGAGFEPSTPDEFFELVGDSYIPYNTDREVPYFIYPKGMKGTGTVYDEVVGKKAIRRYGCIDLGDCSWSYTNSLWIATELVGLVAEHPNGEKPNVICTKYIAATYSELSSIDKCINIIFTGSSAHGRIYIKDSAYTDSTSYFNYIPGTKLYYELATPIEYDLETAVPELIECDVLGIQRRLPEDTASSVQAPFHCDFQYGANPGEIVSDSAYRYLPLAGGTVTGTLECKGELVVPDHAPYQPEPNKHYLYVNDNGNYYQS